VTVDLNGFTLGGFAGSGIAIYGPSSLTNIIIRNGAIKSFSADGIYLPSARNCRLEDLTITKNGSTGATVSDHCLISRCIFTENQGAGLKTGSRCIITDCEASGNTAGGIMASNYCIIRGSAVSQNAGTNGITAGISCVISECAASGNTSAGILAGSGSVIKDCAAESNGGNGIATDRSTVSGCTAWENSADGIQTDTSSLISGNTCRANLGNEIHVTGSLNRIDGNTATGISIGSGTIKVDAANNFIVRNSAEGYSIVGTQTIGPIVSLTGTITTNNPWANFQLP
jgi:hypothetical protein